MSSASVLKSLARMAARVISIRRAARSRSVAFGSAESLTALLLCANSGQCTGNLTDRYLQALSNAADRERAARLTELTLAAIRANDVNTLALDKANR